MRVFRVSLPNFYQIDTEDQAAVITQMISLFSGPLGHCRLMTFVVPASFKQLETARRKLAMRIPDSRFRLGLHQEVKLIASLARSGRIRRTRHYLIDFDDSLNPQDLANWHIMASEEYPQLPIPGDYSERPDHLVPIIRKRNNRERIDNTRYKCSIISSHKLTRSWDWQHPLAQAIADADGPMVICVDIRKIHPERVTASVEFWEGMTLNGKDRTAVTARQEAEQAIGVTNESIHHVQVLYMVLDKDLNRLRERTDSLRKIGAQSMKIDRLLGFQAKAVAMFGPTAKPSGLPKAHFNTLSRLPALTAGIWGVGQEQRSKGFYAGLSVDAVSANVYYLEWKGNNPFHGMILGRTGKGKTVAAQALAWRLMEQGIKVALLEPQGHSQRLMALAGAENVSYNALSYEQTKLNILDVVFEDKSEQYDYVTVLLSLLLDPMGNNPRRFTNHELAVIRWALEATYKNFTWQELLVNPGMTPNLGIFCKKLRQVAARLGKENKAGASPQQSEENTSVTAALRLAGEIEGLYVYGDYAKTFNVPTELDLSLKQCAALFDFSAVPERRRPLFYYVTLASLNRVMRGGGVAEKPVGVLIVDETHYMGFL